MEAVQGSAFNEIIISSLIASHLPQYKKQQLSFKMMQGLTNHTFKVQSKDKEPLLFRKFLGDQDRQLQNKIYNQLQKIGVAPKCYFASKQYRIEKFISQGRHPTNQELTQLQNLKLIMDKIYDFHQTEILQIKQSYENQKQPIWIQNIGSKSHIQKLILIEHSKPEKQQSFAQLKNELIQILRNPQQKVDPLIPKDKSTIKFCHNDLNNLNMFLTPNGAVLIDFQYASYNYVAYDIANFLNESCINYSVKEFPMFKLLQKLQRKEVYQRAALYKGKYQGFQEDVLKCLALCNLYWASWSVFMSVQDSHGNFGAIEHGMLRIQLFKYYSSLVHQKQKN